MSRTAFNIGVSGAGRTAGLAGYLAGHDGIVIRGGYDPDQARISSRLKDFKNPGAVVYSSYQEMLDDPLIDWVMTAFITITLTTLINGLMFKVFQAAVSTHVMKFEAQKTLQSQK